MKKSFKKAGAAVLSMAMLLAMGSVSMPVYAAPDTLPTHQKVTPTQVAVTIVNNGETGDDYNNGTGTKHADDPLHKYDYLETVDTATVTMYRVATLETSGWQWESGITNIAATDPTFAQLLEKVTSDDDGTNRRALTTTDTDESKWYPALDSDTLQALAGKLQQAATSNGSTVPNIASATIHKLADGTFETVYLPQDDTLFTDSNTTKNKIGYYLLVTDTNDTGYVMQPVLIPISNTVNTENDKRATEKVSIKGVKVNVDKSIVDIYTKTDKDDKALFNDKDKAATDKVYESKGGANISSDKNAGVIDADDIIQYQIMADVPRYSKDVQPNSYKITDTPEAGINVIGRLDNDTEKNYVVGVQDTSATASNDEIKIYWSADDELITTTTAGYVTDTLLTEGIDYTLTGTTSDATNDTGKGFIVNFSASQLRGNGNGTSTSVLDGKTMEGGHIFVVFKAKTDEYFSTDYTGTASMPTKQTATLADITFQDLIDKYDLVTKGLDDSTKTAIKDKITKAQFIAAVGDIQSKSTETINDVYIKYNVTTPVADADTLQTLRYAAYLAVSDKQNDFDHAYATALKTYHNNNGTTNTGTVSYNNKFTHDGTVENVDDVTNLYAVTLDLTKKAVENKVLAETENRKVWIKTMTLSSNAVEEDGDTTGAYETNVGGTAKVVWANADGSKISTNFVDVSYDNGSGTRVAKFVTALTTDTDATVGNATINSTAGSTAYYIDKDTTKYASTTVAADAREEAVDTGSYVDGYEHSKPVQGAVFVLEEKYDTVTAVSPRLGGDSGTHARGMAISDKNGKFYYIAQNASTTTVKPTLETTIDNNIADKTDKIVYYTVDTSGTDPVYTTYYVTSKPAWDRVGEGTYQLREVYAPAGYKKWASPSEFTITGVKDAEGNLTGQFTGSSTTDTFWAEDPNGTYSQRADGTHPAVFTQLADGKFQDDILNDPDDTLPATGGIGTVLFTTGGISIVLIAGALFVMYMKKRNSEEEE